MKIKLTNDDLIVILTTPKNSFGKLITFFTKGKYSHSAIYFEGKVYEYVITITKDKKIKNGMAINDLMFLTKNENFEYFKYKGKLTEKQRQKIREYLKINKTRKYNWLKLLAFIILYPTRNFWNKLNFVPFSSFWYGEVCIGFVDKLFKIINVDLVEGLSEDLSIMDDIAKSPYLEKINVG